MSNYSHALSKIISEHFEGKQLKFAQTCAVPHSMVSRHCTGEYRPDLSSLEKICSALKPELCARLAAAHLHDETPPSGKFHVRVATTFEEKKEPMQEEPQAPAFARLDRKTQRALEHLARAALENKDARDALQHTARFLGAEL